MSGNSRRFKPPAPFLDGKGNPTITAERYIRDIERTVNGLERGKCFVTSVGFTINTGFLPGNTYSITLDTNL